MGGVDVGGEGGKKRATNSDINMIPFIDLLMVTIAFLMITAVWVTNSRINASTQAPGKPRCDGDECTPETQKVLHVQVSENDFTLTWKQESTVVSEVRVPKSHVFVGEGPGKTMR